MESGRRLNGYASMGYKDKVEETMDASLDIFSECVVFASVRLRTDLVQMPEP
jgi:hypothetical protein